MKERFNIIKLDAIGSTNEYLKELSSEKALEDCTVAITNYQSNGRGQMGTKWQSETGKNLTFSILKNINSTLFEHWFELSMAVSLAIKKALEKSGIPNLTVKWPNDILSGNQKICGILIENVFSGQSLHRSIIGIGLNVNQTAFRGLNKAGSLKSITGKHFDLDELLSKIIYQVKEAFDNLEDANKKKLFIDYEEALFKKNELSAFSTKDGEPFNGIILGISPEGKLQVQMSNGSIDEFEHKAIELLY